MLVAMIRYLACHYENWQGKPAASIAVRSSAYLLTEENRSVPQAVEGELQPNSTDPFQADSHWAKMVNGTPPRSLLVKMLEEYDMKDPLAALPDLHRRCMPSFRRKTDTSMDG